MDQAVDFQAIPRVVAGRARGGRDSQQDDVVCLHDAAGDASLLVLADGMGGDGAGELASAGVIDVARRLWQEGRWREQPGPLFLEALCQEAHDELRRRREGLSSGEPHSTVVAMLVRGSSVSWAHVGDSRLYRFDRRRLVGRTEDHSLANVRLRRGEISESELATHAEQHMLLRGLGGSEPPLVDHGCAVLRPGETFVLCSDGAWEQLSTEELGRLSRRHDQAQALREAIALAVERGGHEGDNVALIFAQPGGDGWLRRYRNRLWWALRRATANRRRVAAGQHEA